VISVCLLAGSLALAAACAPVPAAPTPTLTAAPSAFASATVQVQEVDTATPIDDPGARIAFRIVPEESEVRFLIDEILAGSANTVVGTTSAVTGEIVGDFVSPQSVTVGPIEVDMTGLRTDNNFRNRAIHDVILQTGVEANRLAVFRPTAIEGLPSEVSFGTPYDLTLKGDLTIHGVTRTVVFDAVVTAVSDSRLEGTASVSLPYSDFDIHILRLPPQVASVGDVVTLQIDFVAEAG
jgi:polyisoprenoid-binding protein YceI